MESNGLLWDPLMGKIWETVQGISQLFLLKKHPLQRIQMFILFPSPIR